MRARCGSRGWGSTTRTTGDGFASRSPGRSGGCGGRLCCGHADALGRQQPLVEPGDRSDHRLAREVLLLTPPAAFAHLARQRRIGEQAADPLGQGRRIAWCDEEPGLAVADDFGQRRRRRWQPRGDRPPCTRAPPGASPRNPRTARPRSPRRADRPHPCAPRAERRRRRRPPRRRPPVGAITSPWPATRSRTSGYARRRSAVAAIITSTAFCGRNVAVCRSTGARRGEPELAADRQPRSAVRARRSRCG